MQKLDKELDDALSKMESEQQGAISGLDERVRPLHCIFVVLFVQMWQPYALLVSPVYQSCEETRLSSVGPATEAFGYIGNAVSYRLMSHSSLLSTTSGSESHNNLQVEQQVADVLRRILPEGVELPTEVQNAMPEEEEDDDSYYVDEDEEEEEWEEEEEGQLENVNA